MTALVIGTKVLSHIKTSKKAIQTLANSYLHQSTSTSEKIDAVCFMQMIHYCTEIFEKHQSLPIYLAIYAEILSQSLIEQSLQCQKLLFVRKDTMEFLDNTVFIAIKRYYHQLKGALSISGGISSIGVEMWCDQSDPPSL